MMMSVRPLIHCCATLPQQTPLHLLTMAWFNHWDQYVRSTQLDHAKPGSIDNTVSKLLGV